jgi:hypothetical protein
MLKQIIFDNPLLVRHLRANLRSPKAGYLTFGVVLLSCCLMYAGYATKSLDGPGFFYLFFVCQTLALHFAGTSQVASSISAANDSGILDFHRISPLQPTTTTLGFMCGGAVREYLVALILLPFTLACALFGNVGIAGFATSSVVLISSTLLFHALAVTAGLLAAPGRTRNVNAALGFLVLMASISTFSIFNGIPILGILTVGPALLEAAGDVPRGAVPVTFFGVALPLFVQSLLYQIPLTVTLVVAATRQMSSAQAMLFSKSMAVAVLAVIATLSLGGIIGHPLVQADFLIPILSYVECFVACLLVLAVTPSQGLYRSGARRSKRIGMARPPLWADDSSNRAAVFVMAGLMMATVQVIQALFPALKLDDRFWRVAGTAAAVVTYFGFATQYFSLKYRRRWKLVLMMFVFLFWLLPLVVGILVATALREPDAAHMIASLSPFFGIISGSWTALIFAGSMAAVFFGLLMLEERRVWQQLTQRDIAKQDDLMDNDDADNPFVA